MELELNKINEIGYFEERFMELLQKEIKAEDTSSRCVFNNGNETRFK